MDAGDLAENERVTQYMVSLFYVNRVVSGKGVSYFIHWEEVPNIHLGLTQFRLAPNLGRKTPRSRSFAPQEESRE